MAFPDPDCVLHLVPLTSSLSLPASTSALGWRLFFFFFVCVWDIVFHSFYPTALQAQMNRVPAYNMTVRHKGYLLSCAKRQSHAYSCLPHFCGRSLSIVGHRGVKNVALFLWDPDGMKMAPLPEDCLLLLAFIHSNDVEVSKALEVSQRIEFAFRWM